MKATVKMLTPQVLLAGMITAGLLGFLDSWNSGCSFLGILLLSGRALFLGLGAGLIMSLALKLENSRAARWKSAVLFFVWVAPTALWCATHLSNTATLSRIPHWITVLVSFLLVAAFLLVATLLRWRNPAPKPLATILWLLLGIGALFLGLKLSDLHMPLAICCSIIAWLCLLSLPASLSKTISSKTATGGVLFLVAAGVSALLFPVGMEDGFLASDKGLWAVHLTDFGRKETLRPLSLPAKNTENRPGDPQGEKSASVDTLRIPHLPNRSAVLITIDALRSDRLGHAGYPRAVTPNLDALASESVVFERAYSSAPASSFSVPAIVTGRPMETILKTMAPLPPTAADDFAARGYRTVALYPPKVFSIGPELMERVRKNAFGFHEHRILEMDARKDRDSLKALIRSKTGNAPTFLWIHFYDPHLPYSCHDRPFGSQPVDCYDAEIQYVDKVVGELIPWLEKEFHNPLIAVTADHGEAFNEHDRLYHSTDLFDEQIRVPMFMRIPTVPPKLIDIPVSNTEIASTMLDITATVPPKDPGNLSKLIAGAHRGKPVFASIGDQRALITEGRKLYCKDWPGGPCALYDLERDPRETRNLVARRPKEAAKLLALLEIADEEILAQTDHGIPPAISKGRLGRVDALPGLRDLALGERREHREEAARLLSMYLRPEAEDYLEEVLESENTHVRAWACLGLALLDEDCEASYLLPFLETETKLSDWSAVGLGRLEDPASLGPLVKLLKSDDPFMRAQSAIALGRLGDKDAVPALMELLKVKQSRWAAIDALGEIGDPSATPVLERLMKTEPDRSILSKYQRALSKLERD